MLPEGLELSKLFYFWLSSTLERYLGQDVTLEEQNIFRENVFGISLSATGLSEVGSWTNGMSDTCVRDCFVFFQNGIQLRAQGWC